MGVFSPTPTQTYSSWAKGGGGGGGGRGGGGGGKGEKGEQEYEISNPEYVDEESEVNVTLMVPSGPLVRVSAGSVDPLCRSSVLEPASTETQS